MSKAKDTFIRGLIDELNDINDDRIYYDKQPLDVCYMVSALDQQLENCEEFMKVLESGRWLINGYDEDHSGGYTDGRIRVLVEKPDEKKESEYVIDAYENYCYYIEFTHDYRTLGYCWCTEEDEGFNSEHNCCGKGCDWYAPAFKITKETDILCGSWDEYEKDYWEYEDRFYKDENNNNDEVEQYKKEKEKEFLQNQIKQLERELEELMR